MVCRCFPLYFVYIFLYPSTVRAMDACAVARRVCALREVLFRVRGLWACCFRGFGGHSRNRFAYASRGSCPHVPARAHKRIANSAPRTCIHPQIGEFVCATRFAHRSEHMRVASRARVRGALPYPSHLRHAPRVSHDGLGLFRGAGPGRAGRCLPTGLGRSKPDRVECRA